MLAEALHSTADPGNELLFLVGMKRSSRPPDELHPYGHGKALYFYSLLVAVYVFCVGGGLAIDQGSTPLRNPQNRVRENEPMIERIFIEGESFKRTNPPSTQAA